MPDQPDNVIAEAKLLISESTHLPMSTVLSDYIKYLTDHPDVYKSTQLSQTMSAEMRSILPDLIVEDVSESSPTDKVRLLATETLGDLKGMAAEGNPRSELAKLILQNTDFLKQAGVVSADGMTFNLAALKIESTNGHHVLTTLEHTMSEEVLADGTVLWKNQAQNVVAAQYENGMILRLSGIDNKNIQSQDDLSRSSYVPTQIVYPNGSSISQDPDTKGWFFSDTSTGLTFPTNDLKWGSPYFKSLDNTYVIPIAGKANENVSRQATFSKEGNLLIFKKTVFNADGTTVDQNQSEVVDSVNNVLKLSGEPTYRYTVDHWEVQSGDSWKTAAAGDIPKITSIDGHLDVVLGADLGGVDRGQFDIFPGGRHLGYNPDGFVYDADDQRTFPGHVQIYGLRAGISNLNQPEKIPVSERSVVVLPDGSTIQMDAGQWNHYAYAADPQNPLSKGNPPLVLGRVGQPIIDSGGNNAQLYFQSDDGTSVPFESDEKARTYSFEVNGALETFNYGGDLKNVKRRDGSVIEFSTTKPIRPVKITFQGVEHPPNVNVSDVTFDPNSMKWMREKIVDGKPVQVEVQVSQLDENTGFSEITITDPDGNQDIFPGGDLPPQHRDVPKPTAVSQLNSEIKLYGSNNIGLQGGVPVSIQLDDFELKSMGSTPMFSQTSDTPIKILIPADQQASWIANPQDHKNLRFSYIANNITYTIVVSKDLNTVTVSTGADGESEVFTRQGVQQINSPG